MRYFDMTDTNSTNSNHQALELLEFNLMKQKLSNFTSLAQSQPIILNLVPSNDTKEINRLQQETNECRLYLDRKGKLDLSMAKDIGPSIHRASIGGTLDGKELWDIFTTLTTFKNIRSQLEYDKSLPVLASMTNSLNSQEDLRARLAISLDDGGNILDGASPTLKSLRLQESQSLSKLTNYLNTVIKRLERSNVMQEQFLTERNGRMVLLVKMEMRHKVPGIVHDVSDSGVTAFVEPIRGVTLGNQWKSSSLSVKREEEVILEQLSSAISEQSKKINESLQTLSQLDVAMAKGLYSKATQSTQPSFVKYAGKEVGPGSDKQSEDELNEYIKSNAETAYHPCGTCKMGVDKMAVVDENLKVKGIQNLRVVDASVMPEIPSANLNAPTLMIAEKASDLILN